MGNLSISKILCLSVHEENVHGQNVFQMNSKWIMEHLFDKRMSKRGYPSILFLHMTEGDLLIPRVFYLRAMTIAEYLSFSMIVIVLIIHDIRFCSCGNTYFSVFQSTLNEIADGIF